MKMKNLITLFFLTLIPLASIGQNQYVINGFVQDAQTGEKLIGAYVFDLLSKQGTTTNAYGFYSMSVSKDSAALQISFIGYTPFLEGLRLNRSKARDLDIQMIPANELLDEVNVVADRAGDVQVRTQMSSITLSMKSVKNLPVLLGETDILKAIQLLPGVQSGTEGTSGFYVRGGGPDQNLILIDGVPVYNVSHLFGFFSVFNADAINNVTLIKGGFPAEYGGRLSSVLDVRMKEGNMKEWHGEGSVGLISSKLTIEGPIISDKTSVLLSGRRTYLDLLAKPFIASQTEGAGAGGYYFYDFNGKVSHKINRNHHLYFSYYEGLDEAYINTSDSYENNGIIEEAKTNASLNWGNKIATARWNWLINPKLFSNLTAISSRYRFLRDLGLEQTRTELGTTTKESFQLSLLSQIEDVGIKWDFDYRPNPSHTIKFGSGLTRHQFEPGVNSIVANFGGAGTIDTSFGSFPQAAMDYVAYIQDDWKLGDRLRINMGLHLNGFNVGESNYLSLQPRLSARYLLNEKSSIKWSYVEMTQYMHLLANQTIGLPTDLWVPVTENIRPQEAWQTAIGYAYNFGDGWELTLEGYYKDMQNLIEYKDGASFLFGFDDWQEKVTTGRGWAYGTEFLLEKRRGRTTGWLGYTLAKTMRQFDEINFGDPYPYTFDRRHDVSFTMSHKFNEYLSAGMVWVYGTGRATTLATRQYLANPNPDQWWNPVIEQVGSRNNFREPAYHRLDMSITYTKPKSWGEASWQIGVYNAYNRVNIFYMDFGSDNNNNRVLKGYGLFPIIPSISYAFKF